MSAKILAAVALAVTLCACGGGSDAPESFPSRATVEPFAMCQVAAPGSGIDAGRVAFSAESFTYPEESGVQDWRSAALSWSNTGSGMASIQVTLSAERVIASPSAMSVDLILFANDDTAGQIITDPGRAAEDPRKPDPRSAGCAMLSVQAGTTSLTEMHRVVIAVPPGHTITLRSAVRVAPPAGTAGFVTLDTRAFDLSAVRL